MCLSVHDQVHPRAEGRGDLCRGVGFAAIWRRRRRVLSRRSTCGTVVTGEICITSVLSSSVLIIIIIIIIIIVVGRSSP